MPEKNIADSIQNILDKNKGFMAVTKLISHLSAEIKRSLGIKDTDSVSLIRKKLELSLDSRFIFRSKGRSVYILIPCEPSELVLSLLPANKPFDMRKIHGLPFTKAEFTAVINELAEEGKVKITLNDNLKPRIFLINPETNCPPSDSKGQSEYSQSKFYEAFTSLDRGKIFVRIPDLRRKLNWPREIFDSMLRDLRDNEIIQLRMGDPSYMTQDEINDCFTDENNFMMGTVTWNGK